MFLIIVRLIFSWKHVLYGQPPRYYLFRAILSAVRVVTRPQLAAYVFMRRGAHKNNTLYGLSVVPTKLETDYRAASLVGCMVVTIDYKYIKNLKLIKANS